MSESPSNSPAKPPSSGGSALKSKIAAFESGAAANASKRDQAKHIPHADLSNLRSRFDREGEKPLEVKGSFGLGAAPATRGGLTPSRDGHRAVSLGIGRAVSPMQSPSVILPGSTPSLSATGRSASSATGASSTGSNTGNADVRVPTASSRPMIPRSDSVGSNSTSATSTSVSGATATSTASSLLPGPLAALRGNSNTVASSSPYGGDDSLSAGLRTPMSSISLSSLHVEAGSTVGDVASSSGDTTANEEDASNVLDREETVTTPHKEPSSRDKPLTDVGEEHAKLASMDNIDLSGASHEGRKRKQAEQSDSISQGENTSNTYSGDSVDGQQASQEAVDRAAQELDKYAMEKPSSTAIFSPTLDETAAIPESSSSSSLAIPDANDALPAAGNGDKLLKSPSTPSTPARKSPVRASSSSYSHTDRLKRSSTANSIASHAESDLADTNLEAYDNVHDAAKAKNVGESMVPKPIHGAASDVPVDTTGPEPEVDISSADEQTSPLDKLLQEEQSLAPIDVNEATDEMDEEGMPLVKCSDCGNKVSLVKLAEHVCDSAATPEPDKAAFPASPQLSDEPLQPIFPDRRGSVPEDVPKGALSPETVASPQMSHRSLTSSKPDVPDDESVSVASLSKDLDDMRLDDDDEEAARHANIPTTIPADGEEVEEDYMTALTSHRDSIETSNTPRPDFTNDLPGSIPDSRLFTSNNDNNVLNRNEDDETEELALVMADAPLGTPRNGSFSGTNGQPRQMHPDSPTPEQRQILTSPYSNTADQTTPQMNRTSNMLGTPTNDNDTTIGVRRRSSAGRRKKNLGDTDSEGELDPGTVTIIG